VICQLLKDLTFGKIFLIQEKHLTINKETGDIEIDHAAHKGTFIKLIKRKAENGDDITYIKGIYKDFYGEEIQI
jgi:hypothetical protein